MNPKPTQIETETKTDFQRFNEVLKYEPDTGKLFWKVDRSTRVKAGSEAGSLTSGPYRRFNVFGRSYMAHRIAWLLMTGKWPTDSVDHIDQDTTNNRWANLRAATTRENAFNRTAQKNSSTGIKGVCVWTDSDGYRYAKVCIKVGDHKVSKSFSVLKYGEENALLQAKQFIQTLRPVLHGEFASN